MPDLGDGRYKNPVLYADYSDPDVIRVGDDFYLVSSSFNMVPGLPILHSKDLVNWEIVAHVFASQAPEERYKAVQHGDGAWAPAIRFHRGKFFLYYPDPDIGILVSTADRVTGPWTKPIVVKAAPGWIDPCPFWDTDGKGYLVNAAAASRGGVKGVVMISRLAEDGMHLASDTSIIIDGHGADPTLEGPKLYKHHGWYYVFAPAGGVSDGWQVVYRSKNIYGPYERKVVLARGNSAVNGPHQGAWVDTPLGEDWFLHFQDQGPYGRVVHLEPMKWIRDWPVIGDNSAGTGIGQPVSVHAKPRVTRSWKAMEPATSDEFNHAWLGLQWQWQANPLPDWAFPSAASGTLRLVAVRRAEGTFNLWDEPNVLTQKLPAPEFVATTKVTFTPRFPGEETGLVLLGQSYAYIGIKKTETGLVVRAVERNHADRGGDARESASRPTAASTLYLRLTVRPGAIADFSYSEDGREFHPLLQGFKADQGRWIGATMGIFVMGTSNAGESGYADFDWFRVQNSADLSPVFRGAIQ